MDYDLLGFSVVAIVLEECNTSNRKVKMGWIHSIEMLDRTVYHDNAEDYNLRFHRYENFKS
jgi:hypothetical protein